ncbi:Fc.00g048710.m01.CDS01 [Cosmosporella sp. VM-42]
MREDIRVGGQQSGRIVLEAGETVSIHGSLDGDCYVVSDRTGYETVIPIACLIGPMTGLIYYDLPEHPTPLSTQDILPNGMGEAFMKARVIDHKGNSRLEIDRKVIVLNVEQEMSLMRDPETNCE